MPGKCVAGPVLGGASGSARKSVMPGKRVKSRLKGGGVHVMLGGMGVLKCRESVSAPVKGWGLEGVRLCVMSCQRSVSRAVLKGRGQVTPGDGGWLITLLFRTIENMSQISTNSLFLLFFAQYLILTHLI